MPGMNALGSQLQRGDGDPTDETFTEIANVFGISGPSMEREEIDVTSHDSPDGWMEFLGGLKDGGEVEVECNFDPSEHDQLFSDFEDSEPRNYKIVWPDADATEWSFTGIMTGFEVEAPHDDKAEATLTFKVSGKPELSTVSS